MWVEFAEYVANIRNVQIIRKYDKDGPQETIIRFVLWTA